MILKTVKITLCLALLNCAVTFAQGKAADVQVEYELSCNTSWPTQMFTTLSISDNISIYQEKYSTAHDWKEKAKPVSKGVMVFGGTDPEDPYLKIDRNKKEILFFSKIAANNFLVKDNYINLIWEITSETKSIVGYNCVKATTRFRGREWVAWFTPDIPLSFGPWKLHGLPGLIVEAHDTTNKYSIKAVKIEYKKNPVFDKDFSTLMEKKNKQPISYQEFIKDTQEAQENLHRKLNENREATVTVLPVARDGEELEFEWEK